MVHFSRTARAAAIRDLFFSSFRSCVKETKDTQKKQLKHQVRLNVKNFPL